MRNRLFTLMVSVLMVSTFVISFQASATTFGFKWAHKPPGGPLTFKIYKDHITNGYNSAFSSFVNEWESTGLVSITTSNNVNSNVDMYSVAKSQWNNNGWKDMFGFAQPWYNGTPCVDKPQDAIKPICNTNVSVTYAGIFLQDTPEYENMPTFFKRSTLAHELGHVMGLAHPSSTSQASIMQLPEHGNYQYVTMYDINDLVNKYGF